MGHDLDKTEQAYVRPSRWSPKAVGLAIGTAISVIAATLAVTAGALGTGTSAQAHDTRSTQAGFTPGESSRLERIEGQLVDLLNARQQDQAKLAEVSERLAHIEGKLDRGR